MTVRLCEVALPSDDGPATRLTIDRDMRSTDEHGSAHPLTGDRAGNLHDHPFYFQRSAAGAVTGVLHHAQETAAALGAKRALAAHHQLVFDRTTKHQPRTWKSREGDAIGHAHVQYRLRRRLVRDHGGATLVHKRLSYVGSSVAVPRGFRYSANTTTALLRSG
eukprot:2723677-Prymnesium_polylepis.1